MITALIVLYCALSVFVSAALIAACALSGRRSQELPLSEASEVRLAIAEVQLAEGPRPKRQLQTSLSTH